MDGAQARPFQRPRGGIGDGDHPSHHLRRGHAGQHQRAAFHRQSGLPRDLLHLPPVRRADALKLRLLPPLAEIGQAQAPAAFFLDCHHRGGAG